MKCIWICYSFNWTNFTQTKCKICSSKFQIIYVHNVFLKYRNPKLRPLPCLPFPSNFIFLSLGWNTLSFMKNLILVNGFALSFVSLWRWRRFSLSMRFFGSPGGRLVTTQGIQTGGGRHWQVAIEAIWKQIVVLN